MVETWQVLLAVAAIMVFYAGVSTVMGSTPSVVEMVVAIAFGLVGWFLGQRLTERFAE